MIDVKCECGHVLHIEDKYAGQTGKCKHCGKSITVPMPVSSALDAIDFASPSPSPSTAKRVTVQCMHCREMMDIEANNCPHCGKPGGIKYGMMILGALVGTVTGYFIQYQWVFGGSDVTMGGSAWCMSCCLNPAFWATVFPGFFIGAGVGYIIGAMVVKKKIADA